jgi:AcrR family transcriptional regulator
MYLHSHSQWLRLKVDTTTRFSLVKWMAHIVLEECTSHRQSRDNADPIQKCSGGKMLEMEETAGVRDAIIAASLDVFCRDGIRTTEISKVLARAGVSESAFYEQFQSKEDLVSAFLQDRHAIWMRWFENEIETQYEATGGGLEIIADVLQKWFEDPKFYGCAFINAVTAGDSLNSEPFEIPRESKEHLRRLIEQLAVKMGLEHPELAAPAVVLVIERTIVRIQMTGNLKEAQTARLLFQCLQHA